MRRVFVLLAVVAALAVPAGAQAATTVQQFTFDATFTLCNGDPIHVAGPLLITASTTPTPSGGLMLAIHFQPQGVTGVDLSTGTVFRATGLTRDLIVYTPPGGYVETFVNQFHVQATGGAQSYIVTTVFHLAVTPDGTFRVYFDNMSATC
jgi:hypothetical protein